MLCCSPAPSKLQRQRPRWEVADIFRDQLDQLGKISAEKWKVVNALISCRTARLGGHVYECDHCGHTLNTYNSCRNRHCPKCQAKARSKWLQERMEELLPVEYFHVVFTIPDLLNPLTLINKEVVYEILFRAAKETLVQSSANPKNLGARIGFLAILHTWGQNLVDHPHIHCVVPGGGLSPDGSRWISCPKGFFVSVKILSRLFRGKFLDYLKKAFQDQRLRFFGNSRDLEKPKEFQKLLDQAYSKPWVVYAKPPFAGPKQVLRYLGNYTHRVAISNHRILDVQGGIVRFRYKDYRDGNARKIMALSASEFMRRFLLHVLPKRFVRIRCYGFLSNRNKKELLARCRELLGESTEMDETLEEESGVEEAGIAELMLCPKCGEGHMIAVMILEPEPGFQSAFKLDSS
jgi:hypothetical protein